ncbi:MAG: hypothetical protein A2176_09750 [Spirochaetes bacterium RBG_13_51_14]|nr:MAG: hypothetical protein A2176_09750 [Spirochaetes bacterium RBG_13_51_14]
MSKATLLIVEDELVIALNIQKILEKLDYSVAGIVTTGEDAVNKALELHPDLILMDIILAGDMNGIEAARAIRKEFDIPIIYLTANADSTTVEQARDTLPYGYLNKPINERDLFTNIDSVVHKHRMENRLRKSEEKYRDLVENLNDIILSTDENGIITYISPQINEIGGYSVSYAIGRHFNDFVHPVDRENAAALFAESREGVRQSGIIRCVSQNRETIWFRFSGRPNFIQGRFNGFRIILSDISKQKEAEATAEVKEKFLAAVFNSIQDGISVLDPDLTIIRVNETLNRWYSHMLPLEGRRCYEAYHGRSAPCETCPTVRALRSGRLEVNTVPLTAAEGQIGWLELFSFPMLDERGAVTGIVEHVRDITARKQAEENLKRAHDDLVAANEELQTTIEELESTNEEFEAQNRELVLARDDLAEREAVLQSVLRVAPAGIGVVNNRILGWTNSMLHAMTGYTDEELRGQSARMLYPDQDEFERVGREKYAQITEYGTGTIETRWRRKDGTIIDVLLSSTPVNRDKPTTDVIFTALDITERKRAERALEESEKKYRILTESISDLIWTWDIGTRRFAYVSPTIQELSGYTPAEALALPIDEVLTPQSLERVMAILDEEMAAGVRQGADSRQSRTFQAEMKHKSGSFVWVEIIAQFLRDKTGVPVKVLGVTRDITRRKYYEDLTRLQRDMALALSAASSLDEALALCVETAIRGVGMDSGGVYLVNRETGALELAYHIGFSETFIRHSSHYDRNAPNTRLVMAGKPVYSLYSKLRLAPDESIVKEGILIVAVIPITYRGDVIASLNIASHTLEAISKTAVNTLESIASKIGDIIVRLKMQESLKRSEEIFRLMIENSPFPIAVVDESTGRINYINSTLTKVLGYNVDDIRTIDDWWKAAYPDAAYRKKVRQSWESVATEAHASGAVAEPEEADVRCKDGSRKRIEFRLMSLGGMSVVMMSDITEKKITQEMMIQTEKMTSLGGLAAGMAHEINNPLGVILQGVQGALNRLSPDVKKNRETAKRVGTDLDSVLAYLKEREILDYLYGIQDAGRRAATIVYNMLQFSRRSETSIAPVDINLLIDKTIEIASHDYDLKKKYDFKKIQITRKYDPKLRAVPCSETGIGQVILNLLKNSSQAMSAVKKKGHRPAITIRTRTAAAYAVIIISDNGPGIRRDIQSRIFEPFYTTKATGLGTGLGLSVSYYIITKNHGGTIAVSSKPGQGAAFTIKLPLVRPD